MNLALFYDTETSGLPLFEQPSEDPRQPHIVQLGACLVDLDTCKTISSIDLIVRPDGWTIPSDVAAVHGITTELAAAVGVSESLAVGMLVDLWQVSTIRIAHNEQFDARILRIALKRFEDDRIADTWKAGAVHRQAVHAHPQAAAHRQDESRWQASPQDRESGRGLQVFHRSRARERAYRHGRRVGVHGSLFRD